MKIFNKEQDKEKVYVQLNDIMELIQSNKPIPASIIDKLFGQEMLIVDDENRDDFVEFDKKEEINFFKKQDWIVDYKKYRDLSPEDLKLLMEDTVKRLDEITIEYNKITNDDKSKRAKLYDEYGLLDYKIGGMQQIMRIKKGEYNPPFPIVPDSDGFSLGCDDEKNPYKLCISLDPNKYLLYRTDDVKLDENTCVPENFIQTGLCLAFMERKDIPSSGDGEISFDFSSDNKYLIIDTKLKEHVEDKEIQNQDESKGLVKYFKRLFKRKR